MKSTRSLCPVTGNELGGYERMWFSHSLSKQMSIKTSNCEFQYKPAYPGIPNTIITTIRHSLFCNPAPIEVKPASPTFQV